MQEAFNCEQKLYPRKKKRTKIIFWGLETVSGWGVFHANGWGRKARCLPRQFVPYSREETKGRFCKRAFLRNVPSIPVCCTVYLFFVPSFQFLVLSFLFCTLDLPFFVPSFRFLVLSFLFFVPSIFLFSLCTLDLPFFVPSFRFWGSRGQLETSLLRTPNLGQ